MVFWGRRFPQKNEQKHVNLRYYSSKVEFVRSFFGGNRWPKKPFRKHIGMIIIHLMKFSILILSKAKKRKRLFTIIKGLQLHSQGCHFLAIIFLMFLHMSAHALAMARWLEPFFLFFTISLIVLLMRLSAAAALPAAAGL